MEKIQAAIEKARAERAARQPVPTLKPIPPMEIPPDLVPSVSEAVPDAGAEAAVTAAWAALPVFQPGRGQMERNRIVTLLGSQEATAFDVLRTRLLQQMRRQNWHRIAITSPTPSCGKSTIALNLGFSLARRPDLRSILIEMDLRRPSLARLLGVKGQHPIGRLLEGKVPFSDMAQRYGDNLAVVMGNNASRNSAELLQDASVPELLDRIEAEYQPDVMLFDMPPMQVSDDTMAFVGKVDAVLLIAEAEVTTIKQIDACERELAAQTNVMGVVLNKCRYTGADYGYDY